MPSKVLPVYRAVTTNQAPVLASALPDLSWREGILLQYTVSASAFTDPESSALTYSASLSNGAALPAWLQFNAATRTFIGLAPAGSPDFTVRVKVTDAGGLSTFDDMNFFTPAVVVPRPDLVVSSITAPASVVQGNALTFSYVAFNQGTSATGAHYAGISVDYQPSMTNFAAYNIVGALGVAGTKTLTNTISTAGLSVGTHTLYIKEDFYGNLVSEGNENNNLRAFTFTVTSPVVSNKAPVLAVPLPDQTWREGSANQYTVPTGTFTDPENTALTYSASLSSGAALPSWLSFNPTTRTFSGTAPVGSPDYTVRVKAMDAGGLSTFDDVAFVTAAAPSTEGFSITLSYTGDQAYATYFSQAKAIWERVITGDLPDVAGVDDMAISASVVVIDGPNRILAQAGPTAFRSGPSFLPYQGMMQFDSVDMATMLANGSLASVIVHEMGHVLGFGSIWGRVGFNSIFGQYTGAAALTEYIALSGNVSARFVPLETGGGSGTANAHWSEAVFNAEVMTGFTETSGTMPLSRLTIAAMQDLGYTVNYAAADSYALPAVALMGVSTSTTAPASQTLG